jgi:hypothetical protein
MNLSKDFFSYNKISNMKHVLYLVTVWQKHKQSQLTCHNNKCPLIHRNKQCYCYYWGNFGADCVYLMHYCLPLDWLSANSGRMLQTVSWDALYCKTSISSSWGICVINKIILDYSCLFFILTIHFSFTWIRHAMNH